MAIKESLTRYTYSGPLSGCTLKMPDGTEKQVQLINGKEVSLPADHPYVRKLALKNHLTACPVPAAAAPRVASQKKEELTNAG